jgi:hypothetical protein
MNRLSRSRLFVLLLGLLVLWGSGTAVFAQTVVEPLPENNLLQNPWFREGSRPSLAGWTDQAGSNVIWSTSQKQDNPTSDQVLGTSARLAFGSGQGGGTGQAGVDASLYQVVAADPAHTHLQFKTHWVTMWIDRAAVTIYGGNSADGPWTAVWTPLDINQATSSGGLWTQTELLDITIAQGFPFYKVELFGRYPDGRQQGVKYTGVYFAADRNVGAVPEVVAPEPTAAAPANESEPTRQLRETAVPPTPLPTPEENDQTAAVANTPAPEPTQPSARPTQPTRTSPEQTPPTSAPANDSISGVYLAIIAVLLLLVIFLGIGWARSVRR